MSGDLCVEMVNGEHNASIVELVLSNATAPNLTIGQSIVCGKNLSFVSGTNTFSFESTDSVSQTPLSLGGSFNAGDNSVLVRLFNSSLLPYQNPASMTAQWANDNNIHETQSQAADGNGLGTIGGGRLLAKMTSEPCQQSSGTDRL